jgi:large subunit ribosomal protein L32e
MAKISLLKIREELKRKKPKFSRQDSHKKPKLGDKWRRPKGIDSKMRLHLRGYKRSPEVGWGSPNEVKGLSKEGLKFVRVENLNDIQELNAKEDIAVIYSKVGQRKKIELIKVLIEKKIKIYNYRDPIEYLKTVEDELKQNKLEKKKLAEDKKKKLEEKEKKAEAKKKDTEKENKEDKTKKDTDSLDEKIDKQEKEKKKEKELKESIITRGV